MCEEFDFRDPHGRWLLAGCPNALNVSAAHSERFVPPTPRSGVPTGERPYRTGAGVTLAEQAPELLFTAPDPDFLRDYARECGV